VLVLWGHSATRYEHLSRNSLFAYTLAMDTDGLFISYSRKDGDKVRGFQRRFVEAGVSVWKDTTAMRVADDWIGEIAKAIERSQLVLLFLSRNTLSSVRISQEIALAYELKKPILPIELEPLGDAPLPSGLALPLAGVQRAQAWRGNPEEVYRRMMKDLAKFGVVLQADWDSVDLRGVTKGGDSKGRSRWRRALLFVLLLLLALFVALFVAGRDGTENSRVHVAGTTRAPSGRVPDVMLTEADARWILLRENINAVNQCSRDAFLESFAPTLERFFLKNCSRQDCSIDAVAKTYKKVFERCNARLTILDHRVDHKKNHVHVWKQTRIVKADGGHVYCTCDIYHLAKTPSFGWRITGIFNSPNDRDPSCAKKLEWCF
jgi:hypothetical protein